MGGKEHDLEGVSVRDAKPGERLDKLPLLTLPVSFEFGGVGMSLSDLEHFNI